MGALLSWVFDGCSHVKMSFPITRGGKNKQKKVDETLPQTYVVCLECGKELPYSWNEMRVMRS